MTLLVSLLPANRRNNVPRSVLAHAVALEREHGVVESRELCRVGELESDCGSE
jgi:hypothetical protein